MTQTTGQTQDSADDRTLHVASSRTAGRWRPPPG